MIECQQIGMAVAAAEEVSAQRTLVGGGGEAGTLPTGDDGAEGHHVFRQRGKCVELRGGLAVVSAQALHGGNVPGLVRRMGRREEIGDPLSAVHNAARVSSRISSGEGCRKTNFGGLP